MRRKSGAGNALISVSLSIKNDLSFLIDFRMYLYELQSTFSPNLPLRDLFYVARQYEKLTLGQNLYSHHPVKLPTPHFIVFYNGTDKQPETRKIRLSDAYEVQEAEKELELSVTVLNINSGYHEELKEKCQALKEYAEYVARVREHTRERPLHEGVELAVSECIREGILRDFLLQNRAEVISMSIFEYDQEAHMKLLKKEYYADGWEDGREEGRAEGRAEGITAGKAEGGALVLITLVQNWIKRGLKEEEIVNLTEEPQEKMRRLIQIIKENPEMDNEQIRRVW
ncbi:MAG: hypothetical protein K2I01_02825 [Lachnospiraceae bacterium]|nr:hypothetical protein [Lachnospiraceae bacterium]